MLGTIGQFTSIFGTMFYENRLKDIEVRTVLYWSTIVSVISSVCCYAFAMRWNKYLHINDIVFIVVTDTIFNVISMAMNTLPTMALFAKVTPHKIEGTVFAFLTGTTNLANNVISPMIGVWINERFVGVTAEDLSKYKYLCLVGLVTSFLGFLILPLIPLKEDIQKYQQAREEERLLIKQQRLEQKGMMQNGAPALNLEEAIAAVGKENLLDGKKTPDTNEDEEGIQDLKSRGSSNDIAEPDDIEEERKPLII